MKTNYINLIRFKTLIIKISLLFFCLTGTAINSYSQERHVASAENQGQLLDAMANPDIIEIEIKQAYTSSDEPRLKPGTRLYKMENGEGGRSLSCLYGIQQANQCFDPIAPETTVCDTAVAFSLDLAGCGCCPPDDAGTWSLISGPGNVTFSSYTEDTLYFCVDEPGSYLLRYTWGAPWFSKAETQYFFYGIYSASLSASDSCGLTTTVHFEYSTVFGDPSSTLTWTLNGAPYDGPDIDSDGDTVDFQLAVPYCGEWTLEATLTSSECDPVNASVTVNLFGNTGPEIVGVGPDTTVVCPDEPVFSEPTAFSQCDPDPDLTFTTDSIPGDCPDHYTLVRTWTAVDGCGNTSTESQSIEHLPNPHPPIIPGEYQTDEVIAGDTIFADCDGVSIPFPEINTPCGQATVYYERSDGGAWGDPYQPGTTTDVCYWGVNPCGYSTDTLCFVVVVATCADEFCTLTQGFYGNNGNFCNGMSSSTLIESLLAQGNLVVGYNSNKMTFYPGNSGCIIDLLPGGGPAKKITGANTCASHPGIQMKNGRIYNVLLAQTITLGLNMRLAGDLGSLQIFSDTLVTAGSSGCDQQGDTVNTNWVKRALPLSVYNVLSLNGTIIPTVAELYALANKGLGGGAIGATTLQNISDAVALINEGFDECRFGYFEENMPLQSMPISGGSAEDSRENQLSMRIFPNPFNSSTNIEFVAPENGHISVQIFNLTGMLIATLYDGTAEAGESYKLEFRGNQEINQMTYVCVIKTEHESRYRRIIMMR